jgi:membrane-associated protease RseP (regulator of RpoE activity)
MKKGRVILLAAVLALNAGAAFAQQPRTPAPPTPTATPLPSKVQDSTFARRSGPANEAELLRVVNELRAREQALLRELEMTSKDNEPARRDILVRLQNLSREAFTVMSVVEGLCIARSAGVRRGYMGVNVSSSMEARDGRVTVQQSTIESVEPGSPADRAGLMAGDRLLSVGGADTRNEWPDLGGVLEPGRRIVVKVERNGQDVELPLVVGEREAAARVVSCPTFERTLQPLRMGPVARGWVTDTSDVHGNRFVIISPLPPTAPTPGVAAVAPTPSTGPTPPTPPAPAAGAVRAAAPYTFSSSGGAGISYFAGAQFRALNEDWRSVLGIAAGTAGVLVTEVAPGSAAAQAGLRAGDVITDVNGTAATSPFVASRLMSLSENATATLRVVRARERRTVTMRWDR